MSNKNCNHEHCKIIPSGNSTHYAKKVCILCSKFMSWESLTSKIRVELNVPYSEKEEAKALGARWCPHSKKWYTEISYKKYDCSTSHVDGNSSYTTMVGDLEKFQKWNVAPVETLVIKDGSKLKIDSIVQTTNDVSKPKNSPKINEKLYGITKNRVIVDKGGLKDIISSNESSESKLPPWE